MSRIYSVDGRFTVDFARRILTGGDSEVHLRPKTFTVLEILIQNRDRMLSKNELLTTVWEGTAVTDDVLVTSITEIRRGFGDDPKAPRFIKTIHGTGYRWIASVEQIPLKNDAGDNVQDGVENKVEKVVENPAPAHVSKRLLKPAVIAAGILALVSGGALTLHSSRGVEHKSEVAWWRFDESGGNAINDSSGHGNSGQIYSGVERVPGRMGRALRFDGLGDGIGGRTGSSIPMGNASRTITAWVKTDSTNGDFTNLLHYGLNGPQPPAANFVVALTPDGRMRAGNGFVHGFITGQAKIDDGAWHSIAAVYEGPQSNVERIYTDGLEDASGKLNGTPATLNGGTWAIGKFLGGGTRFRGVLDDVRVFDRALRPAEVQALSRCSTRAEDLKISDAFYYLPVMGGMSRIENGEIVNSGLDIAGVQLAKSDGVCAIESLRGAPVGQDLYLSAELKTPASPNGLQAEAGIYFRSRKAYAGDGIIGGTSAGYWVRLSSGGQVAVICLNPGRVVAFTNVPDLATDAYHRLEVVAIGTTLQVSLDGKLLEFDQAGHRTTSVSIPSFWDSPPKTGDNDGTAGIVFSAGLNRGQLGGQSARNFAVRPATEFLASR